MSQPLASHRIGFIGLGLMGRPMVEHLHRAGAEVVIHNRSQTVVGDLAAKGLSPAQSSAEVARAVAGGLLFLCLPRTETVLSVLEGGNGQEGLWDALAPGTVVVDFGTTSAVTTRQLAARAAEKGVGWVDAPVSGGEVGAKAASLTIMVGANSADYERARILFPILGAKHTHLGPAGSGQVTKLANQMIVAQTIDAVAQALAMAKAAGVDPALAREALRGGFADSRILELHGDRMVRRDFTPGGRAELQLKDVRLIQELIDNLHLDFPTQQNSLHRWETMVEERGLGGLDHSGLFRLYVPEG